MFHIVGLTPEAPTVEAAFDGNKPIDTIEVGRKEIQETYEMVSSATDGQIDWVLFGCPHVTLQHIRKVASLLEGKRIHDAVRLIVATSEPIYALAQKMGFVDVIQGAGGFVVYGLCANQFPQRDVPPGYKIGTVAVDRAGAAHLHKVMGVPVLFGNIEKCINAAIAGIWEA